MTITPYHAKYFAHELTRRCPSDSLEKLAGSLADAQVDLNPHQVEAALFAFRSPLSKGAILADEVGLGKTIEAGIVLSQKWAERKRRILLILPANLRKQWNQELQEKFFLPSVILEAKSFNQEIKNGNLNPFDQKALVICSYQFARSKEPYLKAISWDLVIIDEAHRLRNVYKPDNKIGNAIKNALAHVPKILLTATPLQNSLLELYGLVSLIDEHIFGDLKSYKTQFSRLTTEDGFDDLKERLKPICQRTLRRQVLEYIKYTNRIPVTQEFYPTEPEQDLYNKVSEYLQRPRLYALPSSQRKLMTLILRKLLASSTYAIAGTLDALIKRLSLLLETKRITTSSIERFFPEYMGSASDFEALDDLSDEWDEDEEDEGEEKTKASERVFSPEELIEIQQEKALVESFAQLAKEIQENSKGQVLMKALTAGFAEAEKRGADKKAIIFTESTRTQKYLLDILSNTEYAGKIVLFNGSNNDPFSRQIYQKWLEKNKYTDKVTGSATADKRAALVDFFKDEAVVMIATEAAAEGINLQFCSLVVNYDLPWNPQRIEQRIGRCHRYGQKHDVVVVNFLNKANAADERVYELLSEKFKLFDGVFGASDQVLGSIESGVDFEKRISEIYQSCRTEEEIQISFDALQQEMEQQITDRLSMTRQKLLENFDEEVTEKLRINLEKSREYLNKYETLLWNLTQYSLWSVADFEEDTPFVFDLRRNPYAVSEIPTGRYRMGRHVEDAHIYRLGHPLAQEVINACKTPELPLAQLVFDYTGSPKKINILEGLLGQGGYLRVELLTIDSFETEDYMMLSGVTETGETLEPEQCARLFSLEAQAPEESDQVPEYVAETLKELGYRFETELIQANLERNSGFFDTEMEKLEKWADDIKASLEIQLKELDKEIKFRKTEAKKILNLEQKVKAQREIKDLEKKRNQLRMSLYEAQDDVDNQKEELMTSIETRLRQKTQRTELFTIRWKLV